MATPYARRGDPPNVGYGWKAILGPHLREQIAPARRSAAVQRFKISVVNETFATSEDHEAPSVETARSRALQAALQIGVDELLRGKNFFAAEVKVEAADELLHRLVVSVGASPIQAPQK